MTDCILFPFSVRVFPDCGIRPTTATEIEWLQDYVRKSNSAAAANANKQTAGNKANEDQSEEDDDDEGSEGAAPSTSGSKRNSLTITNTNTGMKSPTLFQMDTDKTPTTNTILSQAQAAQRPNYNAQATIRRHNLAGAETLGGPSTSATASHAPSPLQSSAAAFMGPAQTRSVRDLPHFPDIEEALGPDSSSPHGIFAREVWRWFEDHLNSLLDSVRNYRFDQFEIHLRSFWSNLDGNHREVVHAPAVAGLMAKADALVYNVCSLSYLLLLFSFCLRLKVELYLLIIFFFFGICRKFLRFCVCRCSHLFPLRL